MKTSNKECVGNNKTTRKLGGIVSITSNEQTKRIKACIVSKHYRERKKIKFYQLSRQIEQLERVNYELNEKIEALNNILFSMQYELFKTYF